MRFLKSGSIIAASLLAFGAGAQSIVQIASAGGVSFFVKSDGSLWRGNRTHAEAKWNERVHQLMNEIKQHPSSSTHVLEQMEEEEKHLAAANFYPVELIASNGVTAVAMNGQHDTFFIKKDGSLWAMGNNQGGFLGDGTFETRDQPVQLVTNGVASLACGESFTLFLKDNGSVWGFGWNGDGPLGDGTQNIRVSSPKQLVSGGVVAIAAGYLHTLLLKYDGSLWGMGNNGYGQLGLGTNVNHALRPVEIVSSNVVSIAAAHGHSLFIKTDGSLWAMGLNDWGQIGDCSIAWAYRPRQIVPDDVVAAMAGYSGSLFLKKDGSLWGMGNNWQNDYGEGIEFQSQCPTQIFAPNNSAVVAGYYYNARLKTCIGVWPGRFDNNSLGAGFSGSKAENAPTVTNLSGSNLITIEQLKNGNVRLTYSGNAKANYALEWSSNLANPKWLPLVTNTAPGDGVLVITNIPDASTNNFWRICSIP
jgi:alpha-tubulin suppressor-like RCC1 family protein